MAHTMSMMAIAHRDDATPIVNTTPLHITKGPEPVHTGDKAQPTGPNTPVARDDTSEKIEKGSEPSLDNHHAESAAQDLPSAGQDGAAKDLNVVEWNGPNDPENPQNWPRSRKWLITCTSSMMAFVCTFASSIFSTASRATSQEFGVSTEVTTLGTSLFLAGFIVGPLLWGPSTELLGRKIPLFSAYAVFAVFEIPVAVAQNLQTIMVCRFFGGVFGVAPLVILPGLLADIWDPVTRGIAMCLYSASLFVSPCLAPFIGGFITDSSLGWRWTAWITLIMAALFGLIALATTPETYAPVILQQRAKRRRFETKNWALHAKFDETQVTTKEIITKHLIRPCVMLVQEPVLFLMTLYLSLVYGLLYLTFEAFPISFQQQRGWNEGVGGLPYLSFCVGCVLGLGFNAWFVKVHYEPIYRREGKVPPEERLLSIMIGAFLLPIGLFWFGWTSFPSITPWPQIIAAAPIGAGIALIFLQGLNYIIDVYLALAGSAVAANTFARSIAGAGFPMFATPMFHNLGVPWASSLLAFLALALAPVPFLFYRYGAKLRKMSKFSPH